MSNEPELIEIFAMFAMQRHSLVIRHIQMKLWIVLPRRDFIGSVHDGKSNDETA
jgi:hypothetical protein